MSEPFVKPNHFQIEKARELYGDPLLYWAMNTAIQSLQKLEKKEFYFNIFRDFYALARLVILNYNSATAFNLVEIAVEDLADEKNYRWLGEEFIFSEKESQTEISIDPCAKELKDQIKITDVAKKYGVKVKGKMALCPFHADKNLSLSLSDEKGVFHCFGCHVKGDIITFVKLLENLKHGDN